MISAVETSKFLRNHQKSIHERSEFALNLLNNELQANLPRKEFVLLEWALTSLSAQEAQISPNLWRLIAKSWLRVDSELRRRTLYNIAFYKDVCSALNQSRKLPDTVDDVAFTLEVIQKSLAMPLSSANDLGLLVVASLSVETINDKLCHVVWDVVKGKAIAFPPETSVNVLSLEPIEEARLSYLTALLSNSDVPVVPLINENSASDVLTAALNCDKDVEERFLSLAGDYPSQLDTLLSVIENRSNKPTLQTIVEKQLNKESGPSWSSMQLILQIEPRTVLQRLNETVSALAVNFNESFACLLLEKATQMRQLPELLTIWQPSFVDGNNLGQILSSCILSLSPAQVINLLNSVDGAAHFILPALTYDFAAHSEVKKVLAELLGVSQDWKIRRLILDVAPALGEEIEPDVWFSESDKSPQWVECMLRLRELKEYDVQKVVALASDFKVVCRYFRIFERFCPPSIIRELCVSLDSNCLDRLVEYPRILASVVEELLSTESWIELLNINPTALAACGKIQQVLEVAWDRGQVSNCQKLLKFSPKLIKAMTSERMLQLVRMGKPSDTKSLLDIVSIYGKDDQRKHELIQLLENQNLDQWQNLLLRASLGILEPKSVQWTSFEDKDVILAVIEILSIVPKSSNTAAAAAHLAFNFPSSTSFDLVCKSNSPSWDKVLAYHIWTGCKYGDVFKSHFSRLAFDEVWLAAAEAVRLRQYKALKHLVEVYPNNDNRLSRLITISTARESAKQADFSSDSSTAFRSLIELLADLMQDRQALISQFCLEKTLDIVAKSESACTESWLPESIVVSRILLFQRHRLHGRMHLIVKALTSLLKRVTSPAQADQYSRLMGNLCSPTPQSLRRQGGREGGSSLTSKVSQERRQVAKRASVLLINYVTVCLSRVTSEVRTILQKSAFTLLDLLDNESLRGITAELDGPGRAYFRRVYEDYKAYGKWKAD